MHAECGHIKSCWDNHDKCLKCSCCSRESTCNTCSSWVDRTWKLAEKRRTYASRKWVMSKKKKRLQAMSDSSDDRKLDRNTTPLGPAARGRTHPGGNSKDTCTQRIVSPLASGHWSTGHQPFAHWTRRHHRLAIIHWSNGHYTW